jgi:predicted DNA-binding transcriptional regulator AlpA
MADSSPAKLLLTAPEAAQSLCICEKTLWSNTRPRGTIPAVRIGKRVLYDPRDLAQWINEQKERGDGMSERDSP